MKILVADDDGTSRLILKSTLTRWNYQVIAVADGDEAWKEMQAAEAPQLLILDWEMPGIDGLSLCRQLRAQNRETPLFMMLLTAKADTQDMVAGLDSGADDYIAKPYNVNELRARVNAGRRIIELQSELLSRRKMQGVIEMAGAVCHELNQPLQIVSGFSQLLMAELDPADPKREILEKIHSQIQRIGSLTAKITRITEYKTKSYMGGSGTIIDIEKSAGHD